MNWISLAELALIHEQVIGKTGGMQGIINPGGLESALDRPFTAFGGVDLFPDIVSKTAALIHSVVMFHPFIDGNKRTALVAADVCLRLNGFRLVPSDDVEPFFWSVARGEQEIEAIVNWLTKHIEQWQEE